MPLAKRELRTSLRTLVGQALPILVTSNGAADGSTVVDSAWNNSGVDFFDGNYILLNSGTHESKFRPVSSVSSTNPKTFTVTPVFGAAAVVSGVTGELHSFNPQLYTKAVNLAITEAYEPRYLFRAGADSSLIIAEDDISYTLPSGYTRDNIVSVWMEGDGQYDDIPYTLLRNVTYNYDGSILWLNRRPHMRHDSLIVDRKLYLYAELPLTALDEDTVLYQLTTDTTAKVELTANTGPWQLLLYYARAKLFELLAAEPSYTHRAEALQLSAGFLEVAQRAAKSMRMTPLERGGYA